MSPNAVGALLMTVSAAAFVINDTMIKAVTAQLPLFQVMTLRGVLGTVIIYVMARQTGRLAWRLPRRDWGLIALRCAAIFMQWSIAKRLTCSVIGPRSAT